MIRLAKLLRVCIVVLLFRIDWRKLIVACSILMIVSVLIQISKLPYPLTEKNSPPHSEILSYNPLNSAVHLDKSRSLAVGVQLESVRDAQAKVSLNSSSKLDRSMVVPNKEIKASRQRRSNSVNSSRLFPPSLPRTVEKLPRHLEMKHLHLLNEILGTPHLLVMMIQNYTPPCSAIFLLSRGAMSGWSGC